MKDQIKKSMTTVDVKAWVEENRDLLLGARVQNIYTLTSQKILILKVKVGEYKYLLIEPGKRINLSRFPLDIPESPDSFSMGLRKHLREQAIEEIQQVGFDRILKISFKGGHKLFVEILPRGEAVLTDEAGKILQSTGFKSMKDREIKRGVTYSLPPYIEKVPTIDGCVNRIVAGNKHLLSRELGIPPEVISEAEMRKNTVEDVCSEIIKIIELSGKQGGYIIFKGEMPLSFYPYPPTLNDRERKAVKYEKFNDAVDEFYYRLASVSLKEMMSEEEEKLSRMIEDIMKEIESYEKKAKELYEVANLIMNNLEDLREIWRCVDETRKRYGWEKIIETCSGIRNISPKEGKVVVRIGDRDVELSVNKDPYALAQEIFEEGKRLKKKAESAKQHLEELKVKLKEEAEKRAQSSETLKANMRRKNWYEKFRWSITRNGFLVIAGRDVQQNEVIVKKYMKESDVYFHADIRGAPSTVLVTEGKEPSMEDIYDAAVIAASYSKAWNLGLPAVDVFWVKGTQVSLTPPPGEYLEKGSFMIYGEKNYIKAVQLALHFGFQKIEDEVLRFFVGSEDSVKKNAIPVGVFMPGEAPPEDLAKKIISHASKLGLNVSSLYEDIRILIPGRSKVRFLSQSLK